MSSGPTPMERDGARLELSPGQAPYRRPLPVLAVSKARRALGEERSQGAGFVQEPRKQRWMRQKCSPPPFFFCSPVGRPFAPRRRGAGSGRTFTAAPIQLPSPSRGFLLCFCAGAAAPCHLSDEVSAGRGKASRFALPRRLALHATTELPRQGPAKEQERRR